MATRTKEQNNAAVPNTGYTDLGAPIRPPAGIKWTLVEYSFGFGVLATPANGRGRIKFDEEIYHDVRAKIHNALGQQRQKNREVVAIDVIQPHQLQVQGISDGAGNIEIAVELVIEEAAATS